MQLANTWAEHGLGDELAAIIEGIILGDGWAGAGAWKAKWKQIKPVNMLGCMNTLATRDDVTDKLGQIKVPALVVHGDKVAAATRPTSPTRRWSIRRSRRSWKRCPSRHRGPFWRCAGAAFRA